MLALIAALSPAAADQPAERGIDGVCPAPGSATGDEDSSAGAFPDLGTTHAAAIVCAVDYGLVSGFEDGTYRPRMAVTRGQMASFVAAWLREATGFALTRPEQDPFSDVGDGTHAGAIARLAEAGIVGGRADGTFGPEAALTRGQFAQVMVRAISYADVFAVDGPLPPPGDVGGLTDVEGTTFEASIGALAATGIAAGATDGTFRPGQAVTRGQLATFLMRGADFLERHQRWKPTARSVVLHADLRAVEPADGDAGETAEAQSARGTATLIVNAFDGTLFYAIELADVPGPYDPGGRASVHLGVAGQTGPLGVLLADGAALDAATSDRGITGVVLEADSDVRFAELWAEPEAAYVSIATSEHPDGLVRGQLSLAR